MKPFGSCPRSVLCAAFAVLVISAAPVVSAKSPVQKIKSAVHQAELKHRAKLRGIERQPAKSKAKHEAKAMSSAIAGVKKGVEAGRSIASGNVIGGAIKGAGAFASGAAVLKHENCSKLADRAARTGSVNGGRFDVASVLCR